MPRRALDATLASGESPGGFMQWSWIQIGLLVTVAAVLLQIIISRLGDDS